MEYFELRNKLFFPVRRKLINDYQMGTLDFERCEQLVNDLILKNWTVYGHWGAARREYGDCICGISRHDSGTAATDKGI